MQQEEYFGSIRYLADETDEVETEPEEEEDEEEEEEDSLKTRDAKHEAELIIASNQAANNQMAILCGFQETDPLQSLLERTWNAIQKGAITLLVLLSLASFSQADTIQTLTGTTHADGFTYVYDFSIDTMAVTFFNVITQMPDTGIDAILNGTFLTINKHVGCDPCTTTFINDIYEHMPYETQVMWQWGPIIDPLTGAEKWELISGLGTSGAYIVDPVATPEPMTLVLLVAGGIWLWAIIIVESRDTYERREREILSNHPFNKGA